METGSRHRRSKSASVLEGNLQIHRPTAPRLPYSSAITKENMVQNTSKPGSGTPIKKLLAEEMSKENEAKRRQPTVIARLMGLDGLPSPQPGHKQQRRMSEKHQQQDASVDVPQREQLDFIDVYEDIEASHVMNHRSSSRWTANSRLLKPDKADMQPILMSRKCLSNYEDFDGTLQILDSYNERLLKYLEEPYSSSSPYDYISSLELPYSKVRKSTRDGSYKRDVNSRKKREDGLLLQSHNCQSSRNCYQPSKSQTNVKDDISTLTTRIVVLKPHIGNRVNATRVSSLESSHASLPDLSLQYTGSGSEDKLACGKKSFTRKACFPKPNARENRVISKEITRQRIVHLKPYSAPLLKAYSGDESSYDANESDSSSASEKMSSRNYFDGSRWVKHSSSGPLESVVSKEAKRRLSERWKMSSKSRSMESAAGSTLGDVLAIPEKDSSGWDVPQGISSRDGWKDGRVRTLSKSRSLPPSIGSRNPKTSGRCETLVNDLVEKKRIKGRIKSRKGNLKKEGDCSGKDDSLSKTGDNGGSSQEESSSSIRTDINSYKGVQHEGSFVDTQVPHVADSCRCPSADVPENAEPETFTRSSVSSTDLCLKHDGSLISVEDSSAGNKDATLEEPALVKSETESASFECHGPEVESCESSKEADCSPVSVLEVSFPEDVSCRPDCFVTVNAEINDLRMKLQLLKMEAGGYADSSMVSSNNQDTMQHQPGKGFGDQQIVGGGDRWESTYIVDVLLYSGLEDFDPDTLDLSSWHSLECPIDPWVFNSLEMKKYSDAPELKLERRLLFDRVNWALVDVFQEYVNKSHSVMGVPNWQEHGIEDYLHKLLVHQETKANRRERAEKRMDREMNWLGFKDRTNIIGEEIEKLLIDELIGEIVAM